MTHITEAGNPKNMNNQDTPEKNKHAVSTISHAIIGHGCARCKRVNTQETKDVQPRSIAPLLVPEIVFCDQCWSDLITIAYDARPITVNDPAASIQTFWWNSVKTAVIEIINQYADEGLRSPSYVDLARHLNAAGIRSTTGRHLTDTIVFTTLRNNQFNKETAYGERCFQIHQAALKGENTAPTETRQEVYVSQAQASAQHREGVVKELEEAMRYMVTSHFIEPTIGDLVEHLNSRQIYTVRSRAWTYQTLARFLQDVNFQKSNKWRRFVAESMQRSTYSTPEPTEQNIPIIEMPTHQPIRGKTGTALPQRTPPVLRAGDGLTTEK